MARIRTIKPEFFDDYEFIQGLSRDERLYYVGLWVRACDDRGVFPDSPPWLKKEIFPYDNDVTPETIQQWNEKLQNAGRLVRFEVGGKAYFVIPRFLDHQKIDRPSRRTCYPLPDEWTFDEDSWQWVEAPWIRSEPPASPRGGLDDGSGQSGEDSTSIRGALAEPSSSPRRTLDEPSTSAQRALAIGIGVGVRGRNGKGSGKGKGKREQEPASSTSLSSLTDHQRMALEVLRSVPLWPADDERDVQLLLGLAEEFPDVNLLAEAKAWRTYKLDKPLSKASNPRLQFRNWVRIAAERKAAKKEAAPGRETATAREEPGDAWSRGWRPYYRKVTDEEIAYYLGETTTPPPHLRSQPSPPEAAEGGTADG